MRPKSVHLLLLAASAALSIPRAAAGQEAGPPRPLPQLAQELFMVETACTQDRGEVQLTAHSRLQDETNTRLLGEYGVTDRLQLSLVTPAVEGNGDDEESAWDLGVLYAVIPGQSPVAVSAGLEIDLSPDEAPSWEPEVVAARQWGPVQVHASVATDLRSPGDGFSGGVAALLDRNKVTPTLELAWSASEHEYLVPGVFVHPLHQLEAGFGLPLCLGCTADHRQGRVMLTVEF
ncbi:hypothetical protein [Longimicrobium sp.]|uniref:hypothetical protein n=1 Tax=Longimicrobium sp. TaxID=2029185 RepID=UPI002C4709F4|nr:hypothetical protein [Longimicrobium sp.]HSU16549.1 hypothetical protein [Longimicrobium sp.]